MRTGLAEPLEEWLTNAKEKLEMFESKEVLIVGIAGKETIEHPKFMPFNRFLQLPAFASTVKNSHSTASIDAFYASDISVLFLHLSGYGDTNRLQIFMQKEEESVSNQGFFDRLAQLEVDYLRSLTFLTILSHIIIFVEPTCRCDLSCFRNLKKANELRLRCREDICEKFDTIVNFPRKWRIEGRLALPRFLFAFYREQFRTDIPPPKKRELIKKLEEAVENQMFQCSRLYQIAGSLSRYDIPKSCGSIPLKGTQFVYIFDASEGPRDVVKDALLMLMKSSREKKEENDEEEKGKEAGFAAFLQKHIENVRSEKNLVYEIPHLKWLLVGGKLVYDLIFRTQVFPDDEIKKMCCTEIQFSESLAESYVSSAVSVYETRNPEELEKRKSAVYTKTEHEKKLQNALDRLECIYHGTNIERAREEVREICEKIWTSQRACEAISLTNNQCTLSAQHGPYKTEGSTVSRAHTSGVRYMCVCSCGRTVVPRDDPFTLKEANYDFYQQFTCCSGAENYPFEIFKEGDEEVENVPFGDRSAPKSVTEKATLESSLDSDAISGQMDMLPDRDNPVQDDEIQLSQSLLKIGDDRENAASGSDEEGNEDGEEQVDEPSTTSDDSDEDEDEGTEEDDESEYEDEQKGVPQRRAHMDALSLDEHDDYDEEADEAEASYLYDYDVQLKDLGICSSIVPAAYNTEEDLARIRSKYKGLFLECVPNSESPPRRPLFPSWALLCLGSSSLYSHKTGLHDMPGFRSGTDFLFPIDIYLTVDADQWEADLKDVLCDSYSVRTKRPYKSGMSKEKVKLFVGFEYECTRGHRFMIGSDVTPLRKRIMTCKDTGLALLNTDLPLWMQCTCRRPPRICAQLMRLHIVTPKAPVTITLNPRVKPFSTGPIYHTGESPVHLEWAKYYILRFPYVYADSNGPAQRPKDVESMGTVFAKCIEVTYIPRH